jgi:type VI secretion system protein VasD
MKISPTFSLLVPCVLCALAGCAAGGAALDAVGLRKPAELPDAQTPARTVALRLHAADKLNLDPAGHPLALVVRIYTLRQASAFEQAPYDSFLDPAREKEALGADLVAVREVTLVPGQHVDAVDKVAREANFVGIVALYHAPSQQRWRLAYAAADAERAGITVGAGACALIAAADAATTRPTTKPLAPVRCQQAR